MKTAWELTTPCMVEYTVQQDSQTWVLLQAVSLLPTLNPFGIGFYFKGPTQFYSDSVSRCKTGRERFGEPGLIFQKVTRETGVVFHAYNPSTRKLRQGDHCELEASLDCIVRLTLEYTMRFCLKKKEGREKRRGKHNGINRQCEHAGFRLRDLPAPGWCACDLSLRLHFYFQWLSCVAHQKASIVWRLTSKWLKTLLLSWWTCSGWYNDNSGKASSPKKGSISTAHPPLCYDRQPLWWQHLN